MKIGKRGNEAMKHLYKSIKDLFISNEWKEADCELSQHILKSYLEVFKKYNFIANMVPSYLKKLSITHSEIDDSFCKGLAKKFYEYEFLE